MAPGILPVATWSLMKSSIRESFSSDSTALGGGPNSAADRGLVIEANAAIAANSFARRSDDADLRGSIRCSPFAWAQLMALLYLVATSLRGAKRRSNPLFLYAVRWVASRSLSSDAHSRDPLARNDEPHEYGLISFCCSAL